MTTIDLLSITVILSLLQVHINGIIIKYVVFYAWFLSLNITVLIFIHIDVYIRTSFLIYDEHLPSYGHTIICLQSHQLMGIWPISSLGLL